MDDFDMMMEDRLMGCNGFTSIDMDCEELDFDPTEEDEDWEPEWDEE